MRTLFFLIPYNTTTVIRLSLVDAGTGNFKSSPTLASGDVKCSQAGGAEANLGTLPAVDGTNTRQVNVTIADTESDNIGGRLLFADQDAQKEWDDVEVVYFTYGHASAMYPFFNDDALDAAGVRAALGLASANLDTQLGDLPTNAELSTALGTADDAVLAAIAGLNNLSQANVRTAVGLASANLDTQLAAIKAKTDLISAIGDIASEVWSSVLSSGSAAGDIVIEILNRVRGPFTR